jgi:hypothetical protein
MKKLSKAFKYVSLLGFLPSLLYIASIGPVAKAVGGAFEPDRGVYKSLYQPVEKFAKSMNCEGLRKSYLSLWGVKPWYEKQKERWTDTFDSPKAREIERRLGN